jgi:hypothetical protein
LIVISGALVLVAAVLLVLGIVSSITLVYAAIGLSIVSAVFLLVGVFQRPPPPAESREAEGEKTKQQESPKLSKSEKTAKEPSRKQEKEHEQQEPEPAHDEAPAEDEAAAEDEYADDLADFPLEAANADFEEKAGATGADVLVVSGRPRYHVGGCEDLEGRDDSEPLDIIEARELGFTPCGKCRPNETLARGAASHDHGSDHRVDPSADGKAADVEQPATEPHQETAPADATASEATDEQAAAPEPAAVAASAAPATAVPVAGAPVPSNNGPAPSHAAPATAGSPPATAAPVSAPTEQRAGTAPTPPATAMPLTEDAPTESQEAVSAPAAAASSSEPPASDASARRPRRAGRTVLAVASTKEYHRADCDLLEGAESEELTKIAAIRQGYLACGVCKP